MNKRRIERIAATILSSVLLLSSTGILSALAANDFSSATSTSTSSTTVTKEGGKLSTTSGTVALQGGNLVVTAEGEGTKENPYVISNADELLGMNDIINMTTSANKYFELGADIDLSGVGADTIADNGGSLVSVNKSLANATDNVFLKLNGNGHAIKGLNVTVEKLARVSLFGYLSDKSSIENVVVSASITTKDNVISNMAVLVAENDGTVTNVTVNSSKLTFNNAENVGMVAAINNGTISNVTVKSNIENTDSVTANNYTISGAGSIGAVVGYNKGKISNASAINVGMFIPANMISKTIYGGIVGTDSSSVSNSVSTGAVAGGNTTDVAGGVIGKALTGATVNNTYTLVKFDKTMYACAVIGMGGTADMLNDCYWSSKISNRSTMTTDFGAGVNDVKDLLFRIVGAGEKITVDPNTSWGKASFKLDGNYKLSGSGISATVITENRLSVKGVKNDTLNGVNYNVKITLPSTVGNGKDSIILSQEIELPIIVGEGKGTAESPFIIENATDFNMLAEMTGVYAKLSKNITINNAGFTFVGTLDGAGHTITTSSNIFGTTIGTIKDVNVVCGEFSTAVFGKAIAVNAQNINIKLNDTFTVKNNNTGILFNTVNGTSTINDVNVISAVNVAENINGFGAIAGTVNGNETKITNCGVHTEISIASGKKAENTANFVGVIAGKKVELSNNCVSGKNSAGAYSFVAEIKSDDTIISNTFMTKGTQSPVDFEKYNFVNKTQFIEWTYEENNIAMFTGNGATFAINVPDVYEMKNANASGYSVSFDSSVISATVSVNSSKLSLAVTKNKGVVTVKSTPVIITNKANGLSITLYVSNGLEKDSNGNYLITDEYDLTYVGENIVELKNSSFVVTNDIDMTAINEFTPIGSTVETFSGKFNGNGHTISNLKFGSGAKSGLFGAVENATIKNISIDTAKITSNGSYVAALVGHAVNSTIENITIKNSKVVTTDIYSGIVAGYVNGGSIKNVTVKDSTLESTANYIGAVAGAMSDNAVATEIKVSGFNASGAEYVSGVAGIISTGAKITEAKVIDSTFIGTTNVSGIASGDSVDASIENATVENSRVTTFGTESAYVGAGIASRFAGSIKNVKVKSSQIIGGTVGGIVGKSGNGCKLNVTDAEVSSAFIDAKGANTVAAGILGVHNTEGTVSLTNCTVDENTLVSSAAITSGMVGTVLGNNAKLTLTKYKTMATVRGCVDADAVSAAGIIGVIGVGALNNVNISSVNVLGKISGAGSVGGAIGLVNDTEKFNSEKPLLKDCVIAAEVVANDSATQERCGIVIGAVESNKVLKGADSAIEGLVITTYYPNSTAFGKSTELDLNGYYDMDMPNGKAITSSVGTLITTEKTEVELSNLPNVKGFTFDSKSGWISESAERIEVVSSTENSVVLRSEHLADLGIVGYYVADDDASIRIPVHFAMKSDVRTPLKGNGTKNDPYLVSNAYDLETVSLYQSEGKFFALSNDITFADSDFEFGGAFYNIGNGLATIGNAESGFKGTFTGLYNGVVHSINDLKLSGNAFGGLFGATEGAEISNLIIKNADIKGLNYAGVLVGSARDTVIKNVTINNAKVETSELGGITGGLVGRSENVQITDISINDLSVKTVINSTSATVEIAGGVAGVFSGKISNVELDSVKVESTYLAGGVIGAVENGEATITGVNADASVNGVNASGVIGKVSNPLSVQIDNVLVSGTVAGQHISAGIIGEIAEGKSLADAKASLVKDTVVLAKVNEAELCGVAVASASTDTFVNNSNDNCSVFDKVYYSSANTTIAIFGNEDINSYQIDEYKVYDLNNMQYVLNGTAFAYIPYASVVDLSEGNLVIPNVEGNYKQFTAGGHTFTLESVTGKVKLDGDKLMFNKKSGGTVINFNYNDGLTLSIMISKSEDFVGDEIFIKYNFVDETAGSVFADKTVGLLLKSILDDEANSFGFYTKLNGSEKKFDTIYVNDGGFYVDMDIPTGYGFEVSAVSSSGEELKVKDRANEGLFVKTEDENSVEITITIKNVESDWGLRSVWSNLDK